MGNDPIPAAAFMSVPPAKQDPPSKKGEAKGYLLAAGAPSAPTAAQPAPVASPGSVPTIYVPPRLRPSDEQMRWSIAQSNAKNEPSPEGLAGELPVAKSIDPNPIAALEDKSKDLLQQRPEEPGPVGLVVNAVCDNVINNPLVIKATYLGMAILGFPYPIITRLGHFRYGSVLEKLGPTATAYVDQNFSVSFTGRRIPIHEGQESSIQAAHRRFEGIQNQQLDPSLSQEEFATQAHMQTDSFAQPDPGNTRYFTQANIDLVLGSKLGFSYSVGYGPGLPKDPYADRLLTRPEVTMPTGEKITQNSKEPYWVNANYFGLRYGDLLAGSISTNIGYTSRDPDNPYDYSRLIDISRTFGVK